MDALFYSMDGNFHSKQREKPMDKDDVALTEGAAYFVNEADFRIYKEKIGPAEREVRMVVSLGGGVSDGVRQETTCHKFAAMGYGAHRGKVTGIVALVCRHMLMMPSSTVDLNGAEK